ncbi:hypothetical protein QJS66_17320 [Kocuria rhizophila]|nr:hypothetical protein QJS66_17320 [Kocuria rhizophila]
MAPTASPPVSSTGEAGGSTHLATTRPAHRHDGAPSTVDRLLKLYHLPGHHAPTASWSGSPRRTSTTCSTSRTRA